MIIPTVGRVVHYHPAPNDNITRLTPDQPLAAIVTFVYNEFIVNLAVFDHYGNAHARTSVRLIHGDEPKEAAYAEWMPYQKGQAAKTEALEKQLKKG